MKIIVLAVVFLSNFAFSDSEDVDQDAKPSCKICKPMVLCASQFSKSEIAANTCSLGDDGETGLCCEDISENEVPIFLSGTRKTLLGSSGRSAMSPISNDIVVKSSKRSQVLTKNITRVAAIESKRGGNGNKNGTSEFSHSRFQRQRKGVYELGQYALIATITASKVLETARKATPRALGSSGTAIDIPPLGTEALQNINSSNTFISSNCPINPSCDRDNKFRTADGSCNNLRQPKYGTSGTPLQRILPNRYSDGLMELKLAKSGKELPLAREVSNKVFDRNNFPNPDATVMFVVFGQFVDHDLSHVPVHRIRTAETGEERAVECCGDNGLNSLQELSALCMPIIIPLNDTRETKRSCINFVRSVPAPSIDCNPGPLEQMNQITHWLDSSNVYGSDLQTQQAVRWNRSGLLSYSLSVDGEYVLPDDNDEHCRRGTCMLSGDLRNNEQPALGSMHILFMREHNRVAKKLKAMNSNWEDEQLFQNTRRIVNAEWQHIVYNEFLPILLGQKAMKTYGLKALTRGFGKGYMNNYNPSITNEFSAAAFRVGHTLMSGFIKTLASLNQEDGIDFELRDLFESVTMLRGKGVFDYILRGIANQPAQTVDNSVVSDLMDHLFDSNHTGLDLVSFNIQRGRDHGLPGYAEYRSICQVGPSKTFDDLQNNIRPDRIEKLKDAYEHVEDIDLYVGMVMETPKDDALIGDTFLCLIGDTFARIKYGDRFFYDLEGQAGSFTIDQLDQIRKTSLARIICDNSKLINEIHPLVMRPPNNETNPITRCESNLLLSGIPKVDLSVFAA